MSGVKFCENCFNKPQNYNDKHQGFWPFLKEDVLECPDCGSNIIDLNYDSGDFFILLQISHDKEFLKAMIDLKGEDIIEYELKMTQFRNKVEQQSVIKQQEQNKIICPRCGSTNVSTGQRGYSLLTGFIGAGKTVNRCAKCGYKWRPGE